MKEIFDWLREWLKKAQSYTDWVAVYNVQQKVNEAEAKWKEDCCEWKLILGNTFVVAVSHENEVFTQTDMKFCPYCGKRIKIAEVE